MWDERSFSAESFSPSSWRFDLREQSVVRAKVAAHVLTANEIAFAYSKASLRAAVQVAALKVVASSKQVIASIHSSTNSVVAYRASSVAFTRLHPAFVTVDKVEQTVFVKVSSVEPAFVDFQNKHVSTSPKETIARARVSSEFHLSITNKRSTVTVTKRIMP